MQIIVLFKIVQNKKKENTMEYVPHIRNYQENGGGSCQNKQKHCVIFLIVQQKVDWNAVECASDIAKR